METYVDSVDTELYARAVEGSKRIRWDIERDVLRGALLRFLEKVLPDGLSKVPMLDFLTDSKKRRPPKSRAGPTPTCSGSWNASLWAKSWTWPEDHRLGDQTALEALIRFCDEELKHQELFRRIELMMAEGMPQGYAFNWNPNVVAGAVLEKSTWAVLALMYEIELFTQEHYKQSIEPDENLSELYKDVFLYHWKEEAHHAYLDAWNGLGRTRSCRPRNGTWPWTKPSSWWERWTVYLQAQSKSDAEYLIKSCGRPFTEDEAQRAETVFLQAYRRQYIFSAWSILVFSPFCAVW